MSAWDVYWIMQMDSLRDFATGSLSLLVPVWIILTVGCVMAACECDDEKDAQKTVGKFWVRCSCALLALCAVSLTALSFVPSTKTMAAMYVVPAIANNERLQTDLADVYDLGMERLREVLDAEPGTTD